MPHFLNIKAIIKKFMIISKRVPISVKIEERKDGKKVRCGCFETSNRKLGN